MGLKDKMKQAKDMYGNMKKIQEEVDKIQVTGFSKNNEVSVTVTGKHRITDIKITNKLNNIDLKVIEKHTLDACNEALSKVDKEIKSKMGSMMNLPGGFKLPF